jgi:hypothetical protein
MQGNQTQQDKQDEFSLQGSEDHHSLYKHQ